MRFTRLPKVWRAERGGWRYECAFCGARPFLYYFTEAEAREAADRCATDDIAAALDGGEGE